jgi:hypothetical protein
MHNRIQDEKLLLRYGALKRAVLSEATPYAFFSVFLGSNTAWMFGSTPP